MTAEVADPLTGFDLGQLANLSSPLADEAARGERVLMIDPAKTRDNPYQPRSVRNTDADAELDASVAESGVTQPIMTLPADDHGIRTVVTGHRRRDSARINGTLCPAIERDYSDDELESMAALENIQRDNMVLADEVAIVARMAAKHGNKEAARRLGKSAVYVSKAVRISKANGAIAALLHAGHTHDAAAFYELALLQRKAPDVAEAIALQWQHEPGQRVSLRARVAEAKEALDVPAAVEAHGYDAGALVEAAAISDRAPTQPEAEPAAGESAKPAKAMALTLTPATFHIARDPSGHRTATFTLTEGGTVALVFSEALWPVFADRVKGAPLAER